MPFLHRAIDYKWMGDKWVRAIPCKQHNNGGFQVEILLGRTSSFKTVCGAESTQVALSSSARLLPFFAFSAEGSLQVGPPELCWRSPTSDFCWSCFSSPVLFKIRTFLDWKCSQGSRKLLGWEEDMESGEEGWNNVSLLGCLAYAYIFGPTVYWIEDLCFWGSKPRKGGLSGLYVMPPCLNLCWYRLPCAESFLSIAVSWCPSLPAWLAGM